MKMNPKVCKGCEYLGQTVSDQNFCWLHWADAMQRIQEDRVKDRVPDDCPRYMERVVIGRAKGRR
jgi:hypothetical protein